ncbi:MAG: hypothetical protein HZY76_07545 [Anaerolineae bacterium]|nr:MAG: hypothetical protein HZY76_07545 [Anaerolineae bacterium]
MILSGLNNWMTKNGKPPKSQSKNGGIIYVDKEGNVLPGTLMMDIGKYGAQVLEKDGNFILVTSVDDYRATSYFDPETNSWKKVESGQIRNYKIISPEQEEKYILDQLQARNQDSLKYEYYKTDQNPPIFILVGGTYGFTDNQALILKKQIDRLLASPIGQKYFIGSGLEARYIENINALRYDYLSSYTNIRSNIYGISIKSSNLFFNRSQDDINIFAMYIYIHESLRIKYQLLYEKQDNDSLFDEQWVIIQEIIESGILNDKEKEILRGQHIFDANFNKVTNPSKYR